jgi:ubiquinone/menaquinone biosynthesis C-methylase UbiE
MSINNLLQSLNTIASAIQPAVDEGNDFLRAGGAKRELLLRWQEINKDIRNLASLLHNLQFQYEWRVPPQPEHFDHYIDLYYAWRETKNPLWLERGVFGLLTVKQGSKALELCCGDGFNSYHFYSQRCTNICAVDFEPDCIEYAKKFNQADNIEYLKCDIRTEMPEGVFDNVIWDAAIEHFNPAEINQILTEIKRRLSPNGSLSGYTIRENADKTTSLSHHEYEFESKEDLMSYFKPHFKNIKVFETIYPSRHNLYFFCSDSKLPFDAAWPNVVEYRQ